MIVSLTIHDESAVSVNTPVKVDASPTATVPYYALSADGATAPGSWVAGTWSVAYDAASATATATSATVGGSAATMQMTAGSTYLLWCKVAVGSETFVEPVARITCP